MFNSIPCGDWTNPSVCHIQGMWEMSRLESQQAVFLAKSFVGVILYDYISRRAMVVLFFFKFCLF